MDARWGIYRYPSPGNQLDQRPGAPAGGAPGQIFWPLGARTYPCPPLVGVHEERTTRRWFWINPRFGLEFSVHFRLATPLARFVLRNLLVPADGYTFPGDATPPASPSRAPP
eukprot:5209298-Pyramimonas_sp.AAC.1